MDERAGDPQPLAHPPGVAARLAVGHRSHVDAGERVVDRQLEPATVQAVEATEEPHLLPPGHPPVRPRVLLEVAEPASRVERLRGDFHAAENRASARRTGEPGEQAQRGGLAGAVGAEQPEDRAFRHRHRERVERKHPAGIAFREVLDDDRRPPGGGPRDRVSHRSRPRLGGRRRRRHERGRRGGDRRIVRAAPARHAARLGSLLDRGIEAPDQEVDDRPDQVHEHDHDGPRGLAAAAHGTVVAEQVDDRERHQPDLQDHQRDDQEEQLWAEAVEPMEVHRRSIAAQCAGWQDASAPIPRSHGLRADGPNGHARLGSHPGAAHACRRLVPEEPR